MLLEIGNERVRAAVGTLGGQLHSLKLAETEYIWQRDPAFWEACAPLLFPVVGRAKDGVIEVDGRTYPMPIHGFVKDMELAPVRETEEQVTLRLTAGAATREMYPWDFVYDVDYALLGNTLRLKFTVTNRDSREMLFCLGGHPGFNVPLVPGESFSDYQLIFEKDEPLCSDGLSAGSVILPEQRYFLPRVGNTLPLREEMFAAGNTLIFEDLQSDWVELKGPSGRGVRVDFNGFPVLAFWTMGTPQCAPYLCIEPWYGMGMRSDEGTAMKDKFGVLRLEPGQVFETAFSIAVF